MYARRNVFLTFNFISFCSAFADPYSGVSRREAVRLIRSIADGFELSKNEIESTAWPRSAKAVAANILTSAALELPHDEADQTYNRAAHDIVTDLKHTWPRHEYSAVVYYAHTVPLKSDVVFYNDSKKESFDETAESVKVFVKRLQPKEEERVKELWESVEVDPKRIAELFGNDNPSASMTERFRKSKLYDKLFDGTGFRAAAVIPCAYRFVWNELAWQYFVVYGTTSPYILSFRGKNAYKPCGAVVLFP